MATVTDDAPGWPAFLARSTSFERLRWSALATRNSHCNRRIHAFTPTHQTERTTMKAIVLSLAILLTLASFVSAGGACCAGDTTCSGCWMCTGSTLRELWDAATPLPSACSSQTGTKAQATCYCAAYAKVAKAWAGGVCCTEFAPTFAAASNLCNLATYPEAQISAAALAKAVADANTVVYDIWHNDSGTDVPKLSITISAYTGGAVETAAASAVSSVASAVESGLVGKAVKKSKKHKKHKKTHKKHKKHSKKHKHCRRSVSEDNPPPTRTTDVAFPEVSILEDEPIDFLGRRGQAVSGPVPASALRLQKRYNCGIDFQGVAYPSTTPSWLAAA
ncbi:uncharacterized protein L969DRAFT_104086 [Mixia osmundae IAM 14324]|uniref:Uncharacterized protein n=1 Tax=Mixia osmundae (strain CBS 9802 / IAM 14324 / JCM 22182 / KY 12970) TaxID=764103 RepID=G7E6N0_MIXOS|nr:uncharacterized protein L969DRAFT_104086 [Mixia osmundae IAM 14324]KEI39131.1 hypothetical protein L969DRAFT_104086 [Mixia osmundae IAM 14324]GAA98490.1 hypothetical protein E5Q_05176 [Mixia osmundae IAM 14324]